MVYEDPIQIDKKLVFLFAILTIPLFGLGGWLYFGYKARQKKQNPLYCPKCGRLTSYRPDHARGVYAMGNQFG
ncbi:MAG: hypothetical protein ACE5R6_10165 [Candidatus Heimdallarchaeota archaeon]